MYISLDWISDFVDLSDISPERIADRLTMATAEVEGFEVVHRSVRGLWVGEVVAAEKISVTREDGSEKTLTVATVDGGKRGVFQTVCGAPNCQVGVKAPFAPVGATIAEGVTITESTLAGKKSEGILCSAKEIGLSRWHEGLFLIPRGLENGTPMKELIPETDVLIEVDNKSLTHRPDLWGHYGFARELAAIFERELRPLPQVDLKGFDHLPKIPIQVDDLEGCPCYGALSLEMPEIPVSPVKIQRRLHALGQRTKDLMVDVTNYVMWELGQPTHAFDGDKVERIRVARVSQVLEKPNSFPLEGAFFTTLDNQKRTLFGEDILICSDDGQIITPIGLAGVMGGLESEITGNTRRIVLEGANFHAASIRRTAVRLDLRSDASQRFEKSQPPCNTRISIARILQLLKDSGTAFEVTSCYSYDGDEQTAFRPLELPAGTLQRLAGVDLPHDVAEGILHRLGFQAKFTADGSLQVGIPPFRSAKDISIPEDIVEEVLRVYGYDAIPPKMPQVEIAPLKVSAEMRREHKARLFLTSAHQFTEVHNYSWSDDHWLAQLGFTPHQPVEFENPTTSNHRFLRTTLLPNLLQLIGKNRGFRDQFRFLEFGHVYSLIEEPLPGMKVVETERAFPKGAIARGENWIGKCHERTHLAGVSYATNSAGSLEDHYRSLKGALEDLGHLLGETLTFQAGMPENATISGAAAPWMADGYWVEIYLGDAKEGKKIGALGVLDSKMLQIVVPEGGQVVWFELEYYQLESPLFPSVHFEPLPVYPGSWQDFSILWNLDDGFAKLREKLAEFDHPLLKKREFLYFYKGKGLEKNQGSYTWRLWLSTPQRTLNSEDIDDFRQQWLQFLERENLSIR